MSFNHQLTFPLGHAFLPITHHLRMQATASTPQTCAWKNFHRTVHERSGSPCILLSNGFVGHAQGCGDISSESYLACLISCQLSTDHENQSHIHKLYGKQLKPWNCRFLQTAYYENAAVYPGFEMTLLASLHSCLSEARDYHPALLLLVLRPHSLLQRRPRMPARFKQASEDTCNTRIADPASFAMLTPQSSHVNSNVDPAIFHVPLVVTRSVASIA
jgi:hypothetical protein